MELKPLIHYYGNDLKHCLRDGDNEYIKKYTTDGFKMSYQMWNDYSHDSIESFFRDFINEYPEDYLVNNCKKCHHILQHIKFDDLFDILLRRLVIDAFIGFKAEDVVRETLVKCGKKIHDNNVLSEYEERKLDSYKYGVDIMTYKDGSITNFIQVKGTTTFCHNSNYIVKERKHFFEQEKNVNDYIGGTYKKTVFYVYDKDAYIKNGEFRFYINPDNDKCWFKLDQLSNKDGTLKLNVKYLETRVLV